MSGSIDFLTNRRPRSWFFPETAFVSRNDLKQSDVSAGIEPNIEIISDGDDMWFSWPSWMDYATARLPDLAAG